MSKLMILAISATLISSLAFPEDAEQENVTFSLENTEEQLSSLEDELAALEAEIAKAPDEALIESETTSLTGLILEDEHYPGLSSLPQPQTEPTFSAAAPVIPDLQEQPEPLAQKSAPMPTVSREIIELQKEEAPLLPTASLASAPQSSPKAVENQPIAFAEKLSSPLESAVVMEKTPALISFNIDFRQVFSGAPIIYSILFALSIATVFLWLYNMLRMQQTVSISPDLIKNIKGKLHSNQYDDALALCTESNQVFCRMIRSALYARKGGSTAMLETMKAEGKRASTGFWQRLSLLNDIAIIAPMLGLLGTVLGMFYAFYDLNRSLESFSTLFDGLGVSVGTTVAGLIVAIIAMVLHAIGRYRLVRTLSHVENEVERFIPLIETTEKL